MMESGLCCSYFLEAGFAAPAAGSVCSRTKRRHPVVQQLRAKNCTWTSKRNECYVGKLLLEPSNNFPESSPIVLLFSVKTYEDSCETTDMGPCLHPAEHPSWAALQRLCHNKGMQNCNSSWLARVSEGGQKQHKRRKKGKVPKNLVMTPPKCLTARYY